MVVGWFVFYSFFQVAMATVPDTGHFGTRQLRDHDNFGTSHLGT